MRDSSRSYGENRTRNDGVIGAMLSGPSNTASVEHQLKILGKIEPGGSDGVIGTALSGPSNTAGVEHQLKIHEVMNAVILEQQRY